MTRISSRKAIPDTNVALYYIAGGNIGALAAGAYAAGVCAFLPCAALE